MAIDIPPDNTLSQQLGMNNFYIQNLLPLTMGAKSSTEAKIRIILDELKATDITENHKQIIEYCIDACKCRRYTHTRFLGFDRVVVKTSHTMD